MCGSVKELSHGEGFSHCLMGHFPKGVPTTRSPNGGWDQARIKAILKRKARQQWAVLALPQLCTGVYSSSSTDQYSHPQHQCQTGKIVSKFHGWHWVMGGVGGIWTSLAWSYEESGSEPRTQNATNAGGSKCEELVFLRTGLDPKSPESHCCSSL